MKTIAILLGLTCALYGSPIPDFPFIYVKGHAYEEIPTNLAIIRFDIAKHSRVSDEGESALSDASKTIRKALRDLGVNDKEINSSEVLKREEYGEFPQFQKKEEPRESFQLPPLDGPDEVEQTKNKKESYYTLRQRFVLQIKDLKVYPNLARLLMRSSDVSRYDVEFSATNRQEVINKLRKTAFADAKRAAQEIAEASGESLGRIHSVSDMPYRDLGKLIGDDDSGSVLYSMSGNTDPIYEVPPTVSEYFNIIVLFRLDQAGTTKSEQAAPSNP